MKLEALLAAAKLSPDTAAELELAITGELRTGTKSSSLFSGSVSMRMLSIKDLVVCRLLRPRFNAAAAGLRTTSLPERFLHSWDELRHSCRKHSILAAKASTRRWMLAIVSVWSQASQKKCTESNAFITFTMSVLRPAHVP